MTTKLKIWDEVVVLKKLTVRTRAINHSCSQQKRSLFPFDPFSNFTPNTFTIYVGRSVNGMIHQYRIYSDFGIQKGLRNIRPFSFIFRVPELRIQPVWGAFQKWKKTKRPIHLYTWYFFGFGGLLLRNDKRSSDKLLRFGPPFNTVFGIPKVYEIYDRFLSFL